MQVVVNGLMTNYQKTGSGSKLIVGLHGWGDAGETFNSLVDLLGSKYTLVTLDLPGFGASQRPDEAWSLHDYANFVADWLKKIDANKLEAIIGHSFGGAIAVVGVGDSILNPNKLILLGSAGIREKLGLRRRVLWLGAQIGKLPLHVMPPTKAHRIKKYLYHRAGSDFLLRPEMRQTFIKTRYDVGNEAEKINIPTILIYGSNDHETPLRQGKILHQYINNSKLEVIENEGHFLHHNQPEQVAKLIKDFLA